ncbi:MAG: hypothetical protein AB1797_00315 [bacterium]
MPFNNLIRFTGFLRPHISDLVLASVCIGVVDLLTLSIPLFMKMMLDTRCSRLDARGSMFDARGSMLEARCSRLQCSEHKSQAL